MNKGKNYHKKGLKSAFFLRTFAFETAFQNTDLTL